MDGKGVTRRPIVNSSGREEDALRGSEVYTAEFVPSEEEGYTVHNVLAHSRHRNVSMYWDRDSLWWKQDYRNVDRNESK
jgi:hypothetical protein